MVELGRQATDELRSAIDRALRSGIKAEAIADMVAERTIYHEVATPSDIIEFLNHHQDKTPPDDEGTVIYDELPAGLIDLPSAAKKYGLALGTLHQWAYRGKIPRLGRLRGRAKHGGFVVTSESHLVMEMSKPKNKGGRPKNP